MEADEEDNDRRSGRRYDDEDDEDDFNESNSEVAFFHFVMVLASMYMGMLLTNWATDLSDDSKEFELGNQNVWVNMVTQWVVFALYIWTMIAPRCFPDRDFGYGRYSSSEDDY